MMDKQKQIEEMAKDMLDYGMEGYSTFDSAFTETKLREQIFHVFLGYAERLIEKGWTQIPENAVVLTKKEQVLRDYEHYNLGYETHKQESQKIEEYIETLLKHMNDLENELLIARKKTAEKFAERLKEKLEENSPIAGYDLEDLEFDGETIQECIDEICKEFTDKVVQNGD